MGAAVSGKRFSFGLSGKHGLRIVCRVAESCSFPFFCYRLGNKTSLPIMLKRGRLKLFRRPLGIESGVQAKVEPNKKPTIRFVADGRFFSGLTLNRYGVASPCSDLNLIHYTKRYANSSCFSKLSTRLSSSPKACDRRLRKTISLRDKSAQTNRAAR